MYMYVHRKKGGVKMDPLTTSKLLTDPQLMRILVATSKSPKTVQELSMMFGIPIAGCYRKVKELEEEGLLEKVDKILTPRGKRVARFRSVLRGAYIQFFNNELRVTLELSGRKSGILTQSWDPMKDS
ncbi:MAG TPA: hypothetical protein ENF69_06705 [Euryarchaeota archaeon]|nr:hypothetical protein [Euryarchaeota archaeon]